MIEVDARFYDGTHPFSHAAKLSVEGDEIRLQTGEIECVFQARELKVSPRIASATRFIALPEGGQLECEDAPWLDTLPAEEPSEGPVAWLERRFWAPLSALALLASSLAFSYFFLFDALTDRIALAIPIEKERALGASSLRSLEPFFGPSHFEPAELANIDAGFAELCAAVPNSAGFSLEFRAAPAIGPNAFTLPGGRIVVTDELVDLLDDDERVIAVIAHELGHAHYRHVLRAAVKSSGSAILGSAFLGDATSMAGGLSTALVLLNTRYSRSFEEQADTYAVELLVKTHRSPELFASALSALDVQEKTRGRESGYSFLSSHPATPERIARAHAAASAAPVESVAPNESAAPSSSD